MITPSLRTQPEVAREIGFLVMFVSNLEFMFVPILAALLGDHGMVADIIALKVDNLKAKMDILFTVAEQLPNDPLALAVLAARPDTEKAMAYRNAIAHSQYTFDRKTGDFHLFTNLLSERRGKPKCVPLTALGVKENTDRLEDAIVRVLNVGGDRIKDPFDGADPENA